MVGGIQGVVEGVDACAAVDAAGDADVVAELEGVIGGAADEVLNIAERTADAGNISGVGSGDIPEGGLVGTGQSVIAGTAVIDDVFGEGAEGCIDGQMV